jgi:hypothetical protein
VTPLTLASLLSLASLVAQSEALSSRVPWAEILGPLAPVALSPFFGMALLSGLSILISRGLLPDNVFLHNNPVLNNPTIFAVFLVLAVFTSLPRLTKVSKPLAAIADTLETYAGLVAILVVQWAARHAQADEAAEVVMAGFGSAAVLSVISTVNFLVIQTVRFVGELLVWVSPIPFVDALFEAANKIVCAGLIAIYAFSPWASFFLNVLLFLACAMLFRWSRRTAGRIRGTMREALGRLSRRRA